MATNESRRNALKRLALAPIAGWAFLKGKEKPKVEVYSCKECGAELESEGEICEECYWEETYVWSAKNAKKRNDAWQGYSASCCTGATMCCL